MPHAKDGTLRPALGHTTGQPPPSPFVDRGIIIVNDKYVHSTAEVTGDAGGQSELILLLLPRVCFFLFHHHHALVHERDACNVVGDGPVGTVWDMRHWRVRGDTPRMFQPLSSWKKEENSAFRCDALYVEVAAL